MSVKLSNEPLSGVAISGQGKDPYGLPISQSKTADVNISSGDSPRGKGFGVRVPVLSDLNSRYAGRQKPTQCRFDIVERVTTVIQPGSYGPGHHEMMEVDTLAASAEPARKVGFSRQPTFHSTNTNFSTKNDASVVDRIGPYHWNKWIKSAKEGDARDVLYRNSYCLSPEQIRYRTFTLPRLTTPSADQRPWTVSGDEGNSRHVNNKHGEYSKVVTLMPKQPRGTVVKFSETLKPTVYQSDGSSLEVKRVNSRQPRMGHSYYTAVRSVFPNIRNGTDPKQSPRVQERPLKFENSRYTKGTKGGTLFTKHVLPAYKHAFDRDYSSADTFKEYLESLQQTALANTPGMHSREITVYRETEVRQASDYHNQVLQSVSEVNQPPNSTEDFPPQTPGSNIKVEIKATGIRSDGATAGAVPRISQKAHTIDNLSSVRGSVANERRESQSQMPISSSVVGAQSVAKLPSVVSGKGIAEHEQETRNPSSAAGSDKQAKAPGAAGSLSKPPSIAGSVKSHKKSVAADEHSVAGSDGRRNTPMPHPVVLPTATVLNDEEEENGAPANSPTPPDNAGRAGEAGT